MQISQELDPFSYTIRGHRAGAVTINLPLDPDEVRARRADPRAEALRIEQEELESSFIVSARKLLRQWHPRSIGDLAEEDFALMAEMEPEVVILGTGARLEWPPRALFRPLMERGIGFEVMDTAAACRTYNILNYEGRLVVAGLIL